MQATGDCRPDTFKTSGWYLNPKCYEECSGSSPWTEQDHPCSSVGFFFFFFFFNFYLSISNIYIIITIYNI